MVICPFPSSAPTVHTLLPRGAALNPSNSFMGTVIPNRLSRPIGTQITLNHKRVTIATPTLSVHIAIAVTTDWLLTAINGARKGIFVRHYVVVMMLDTCETAAIPLVAAAVTRNLYAVAVVRAVTDKVTVVPTTDGAPIVADV